MRSLSLAVCSFLLLSLAACGGGSEDTSSDNMDLQTVENNDVRLKLPTSAKAGAPFEVTWKGPDQSDDYISIAEKGAPDDASANYRYTRAGSPLSLRPPDTPGSYEVRYVAAKNDEVLARAPITIEEVSATLDPPSEIGAGSPVEISWTGPNNPDDYITIAEKGTPGQSSINYRYTRAGSPLTVRAPDTPGSYEVRYVMAQSDRVIARTELKVTSVSASFDVSDTLMVNTPVNINWEGPNNPDDYVSIAEQGTPDDASVNYTYTRNGNPLTLRTPKRPGQYELRYVMAQNDRVVARKSLMVIPLQARLQAPDSVTAGTGLKVSWIGPNGPNDFVAVATQDAPATDYESRALSRAGSPATVFAPSEPGTYELRYVWAEADSVLRAKPLTVTQK